MSTEAKEQNAPEPEYKEDDLSQSLNDMFTINDDDKLEREEEEDLKDFDGVGYSPDQEEEEGEEDEGEEEEEGQALPGLFGEESEEEPEKSEEEGDADFTDQDLADFNKKLGKDFGDVEELKNFLNQGDKKETDKKDVDDLESAENVLNYIGPLLDPNQTSDEDLLRREFETIAVNSGEDINDEDTQFDIDEKIEKIKDSYQLDIRANSLRSELRKVYDQNKSKKENIVSQREAQEAEKQQADKSEVQDAFASIYKRDSFFGIKPEKERIQAAYKQVNSGDFLKKLQSDKQALAKLAMIDAYENEIHKKASSGLTYSDGIKAVRDEFKSVKETNSGNTIAKAQKRGSAASNSGDGSALISSLIK